MSVLVLLLEHPYAVAAIAIALIGVIRSIHRIGPTEVGLVTKRFSWTKLSKATPVAFDGEAGYQADTRSDFA